VLLTDTSLDNGLVEHVAEDEHNDAEYNDQSFWILNKFEPLEIIVDYTSKNLYCQRGEYYDAPVLEDVYQVEEANDQAERKVESQKVLDRVDQAGAILQFF